MNIIKEYFENNYKNDKGDKCVARICVIRTNTYGRTLDLINALAKLAKTDCPEVKDEDISIVQFAGQRYARSYGIEFNVTVQPPVEYQRISQLEYTF